MRLFATALFPLFATGTAAQSPQWRALPTTNPFAHTASEMAYDHWRDHLVVFGGTSGFLAHDDTALFDGTAWTLGATSGPPARTGHKLAFDEARGETLLVGGGIVGQLFRDTWVWDGARWTERLPQQRPPNAYADFSLTHDEARGVTVLYQGQELYEWDGSDWHERTPMSFPPPRRQHAATYDAGRQQVLIHGGVPSALGSPLDDTWAWDGISWQLVSTGGPALRQPQMVYDRERGVAVCAEPTGACYEFDGATWQPGVNASWVGRLAYDRQRGHIVNYSDMSNPPSAPVPGSTQILEVPGLAIAQPYGLGCGNPALAAIEDPTARPLIGGTLGIDIENAPTGIAFMSLGWSSDSVIGLQLPYPMAVWGLPGCWLLQSDDEIALPCTTTGATSARFTIAVPPLPQLSGLNAFFQPWAPAPGLNGAGAAVGNGVAVTIGAF